MYRYVIAPLTDDHELYVNLIDSSAGHYLSRRPHVLGLIKELASTIRFKSEHIAVEKDMGRVIGNTDIVDTTDKDTIYYAKENKKAVFSRFAKNRNPAPSSVLTLILQRDGNGDYEVTNTWIGPHHPPFPGDDSENGNSQAYWQTHALAHDAQDVQSKTITKVCPY